MIVSVEVVQYRQQVRRQELGLVRDKQTQTVLRRHHAPNWFSGPTRFIWQADLTLGKGFQRYVDKYSEVVTIEPWEDVLEFFRRLGRAAGKPTPMAPLSYPGRFPILNGAAMAAGAEALAGWFCEQQYGWQLIIRPPRVTPDLVFREPSSGRYVLCEVKSSGKVSDVSRKLITEMIKLLGVLSATKHLRPGLYSAALLMLQIKSEAEVVLNSLILEEV